MKEIILKYLEECCQADPCFKEKYDETQLDNCIKFITDMAREKANGEHSIAIEGETIFKWARDFYNDGTAALEAERERKAEAERERKAEAEAKKKEEERIRMEKERYEREHSMGQITIFDILGGQK